MKADPQQYAKLNLLTDQLAAGETRAMTQIFELTVDHLRRLAMNITRNAADVDEVISDTYRQFWLSAAKFDSSRGNAMGLLISMLQCRALDLMRLKRRRIRIATENEQEMMSCAIASEACEPDVPMYSSQVTKLVRQSLSKRNACEQRLIGMSFLKGLSHGDIHASTGLPMGTIKTVIRRGMKKMRAELESVR